MNCNFPGKLFLAMPHGKPPKLEADNCNKPPLLLLAIIQYKAK